MTRWIFAAALLIGGGKIYAADAPSPEAAATIVVYNAKQPSSKALAEYYAEKRAIPKDHLVGLDCSDAEEISRADYLVDIEAPLRARFTKSGWWKIDRNEKGALVVTAATVRFAALMRGVPMKIRAKPGPLSPEGAPTPAPPKTPMEMLARHDEASVDSELSALFAPSHDLAGPLANPYYRRFPPILTVPPSSAPLLVCRLDAPTDEIVRRMIDDSLSAEQGGLWGWAYLDARNIKSGDYAAGDEWIDAAGAQMRKQGIPVIMDQAPETLPTGFPVTNAAIYYGWYAETVNGPFAEEQTRFLPGAIAVHLHSYSASTLRNPLVNWVAPLLARGAAATMGNVYEPYLELTVHFDVLQDRLMGGLTLAESAYAATRAISWMGVVIGDPLYRPYASLISLSDAEQPPTIWKRYRDVVITSGGDPIAAAEPLRKLAAEFGESMPIEALGQAQAAAGDLNAALKTLAEASNLAKKTSMRFRLELEQIEILRRAGRIPAAKARIAAALGDFRTDENQLTLGEILLAIEPPKPPKPPEKPPLPTP